MQLALPELDSPLHGKVKGERSVMAFPFFALSKGRRMTPVTYQDDCVTIEVRPSQTGVATIYDKEILLYIASLLVAQMKRCETPSQDYAFTAHDFLRVIGGNRSARSYDRIQGALERLQGTQIKTNIEAGGEGEDGYFSWLSEARLSYSKDANGKKRLTAVKVRLCDWLYRALIKDQKILTYDLAYFSLSPIERRLYEIARVHCGQQRCWHVGLEKLQLKVGSEDRAAKFKAALREVAERQSIPEYDVAIIEVPDCDGARMIQAEGFNPKITKRTPQVLFTPKGRPGRGPARIEVLEPEAATPMRARPADLHVTGEALTRAGAMFPGYDKYFVLEEWKRWAEGKEAPRKPDAAFLAFFTTYAKNNPINA
ncbi:replication initiator protein A [Parvularcula dongshanensis]|uniref:Plasmid replication initiation protein n=1 Tax=Parvularcula dongshanensis TaxID=1173995 RepID=A0A840I445_9PROT|nr:replication initiator protein A [Parvularcula dongshanensis]MBB4659051.1 plasmid replication initiation protein [Parvularcula dongshanensis]